jgi:hypothetical protein
MFIGHHAAGFASKPLAPRASLGVLMLAPMLLDVLWPVFVLAGIEHFRIDPGNTAFTPLDFYDYPWSHSLLMAVVWGALAGVAYWAWRKDGRAAAVIAAGVVSHWVFDFITHRPDLPLYPGGPKVGLGLWNSVWGTIGVEVALFAAGLAVYRRTTRPRDRIGSIGLWSLVGVLLLIFGGNASSPPPPNTQMVAVLALAALLFPLWAWWVDRHRGTTE